LSRNRLTAVVHAAAAGAAATVAILAVRGAPEIANGTGTRGAGGVLGAIALAIAIGSAAAALTSFARIDRVRIPRPGAQLAGIASLAVLIALGAALGPRLAKTGWHEFRHPTAAPSAADPGSRFTELSSDRYFLWRAAFAAFKAKPIT